MIPSNRSVKPPSFSVLGTGGGAVLIMAACSIADQHASVTRQMGWQCVGIEDTANAEFAHIESVKMWFLENPPFEERASGPDLCSELQHLGRHDVSVTFDVWGTKTWGLHGYNMTGIAAGEKQVKVYSSESGGYHDDSPHFGNFNSEADRKKHPELYHFPLDVFK